MNEYQIDGFEIFTYHINTDDQEWAAWSGKGNDQRCVYAGNEDVAIAILLDILRESERTPAQSSPYMEPFSRQREKVWRPRKDNAK